MSVRPSPSGRTYGGLSADERDAGRRARLLAAIHEVVGTKGYAALTVGPVCAAAAVSTRHFYELYDGKEAAFADLYDDLLQRAGHAALESLVATEGQPLRERVPAAFLAFMAPALEDPRTARILFVEVVGLSPRIEETRLRNREQLIELIRAEGEPAAARGEVADRDFRFAGLALIGAATAIAYDWMLATDRPPLAHLEQQLADLAVRLLTE